MFPRNSAVSASCLRYATLFGAVLAGGSSRAADATFGPRPGAALPVEKLAPIEGFINGEIAAGHIPGAVVLVQHHGQPVYLKAFGKRDVNAGAPMTLDAIFPIHSMTKTITSMAAMLLVDRGKIALDDPVRKYIPSVTRWESGGGGMVSTIGDFARYGQMLLDGGRLDGKAYFSPATCAAITTDHIGPGSGVARNYFPYPGDGFGFGYGFGIRTDPGNTVPPPPGSLGEIKWDGATGCYIVVDRAEDMFFVVMQDSPSGRIRVITTVEKIIYDAFEN